MKKQTHSGRATKAATESLQIADQLDSELVAKLNGLKADMKEREMKAEEEERKRRIAEREQREANKTFAELLEEYDGPSKKR